MTQRQTGFTLVEIAIVLVIIGLLLGGVLKGQELINSAKAKAVINDFRNTATMIAAYQDRFRALPGDDGAAATHLSGAIAATATTTNSGQIDGAWDSKTLTDESVLLWQHLRLANLASGDTKAPTTESLASDWLPRDTEGGRIGVQSKVPFTGMTGRLFVCQGNISGRIAQQVDSTMDDGKPDSGSVQFGTSTTTEDGAKSAAAATTIDENTLYVVCASF